MLGSTADAEDVLQESWLRWAARNEDGDQDEVRDPRAYLVRVVTRQSLNRLRTLQRQRETYVGPWLPEPLVTGPDVLEDVELAESVSFAMLLVLETLSPLERAAFVLREVFGFEYAEIADATDRSPAAVRQLVARARNHVQARRPRFERPAEIEEITTRFFTAAGTGDIQQLLDLMAPDVVLLSDGGGKKRAALRPLHGPDKVARWLLGVAVKTPLTDVRWVVANGNLSVLLYTEDGLDSVGTLYAVDGKITEIYLVRNPDKLRDLDVPRQISAR
ncbi:sigma-70 family RNA polymerase sigma factor [Nocardioides pocheonensis]|uniref:Sigma-70 family RNA polymerase sigma factor n=2 Tax=Nocardioides pocheonensis TaxID=661485 RepID=A0A3N0GLZ0_9ACTN|nr:sigma-70 family RNA polymerase sigma factor [Nocardioides pocheonensis]